MTTRIFVCHAKSDIESTSEAVDRLEIALDFRAGSLLSSSLPGYSSDIRSHDELRSMFACTDVALALTTATSAQDPEFSFELGVAWALGIDVIPVLYGTVTAIQLPWPLRDCPAVHMQEPGSWDRLIDDLCVRLGVGRRVSNPPAVEPVAVEPVAVEPVAAEPVAVEPVAVEPVAAEPVAVEPVAVEPVPPTAASEEDTGRTSSVSIAPVMQLSQSESAVPTSDVFARLPTCEMSLEAGRAVSDCVFNRSEISDLERELSLPLGRFVDAIGGTWSELRRLHDLDLWMDTTESLLTGLPGEWKRIAEWYQLGFELATLHNLAGQLVLDGPDRSEAGEQQWRTALERFLMRAENAQIGYEKLGRVLPLLENLAGPRTERDLTNIGRSLDEVRGYAAGADGIHTAA